MSRSCSLSGHTWFPLLLLPKLSIRCTSMCKCAMITQAWHFNQSCQLQRSELRMTWRWTSCEVATNFVQSLPAYIADFVASGLHIQQCMLILSLYNVHYLCTCAGVSAAQSSRWAAHIKQVPFTIHYMLFTTLYMSLLPHHAVALRIVGLHVPVCSVQQTSPISLLWIQ